MLLHNNPIIKTKEQIGYIMTLLDGYVDIGFIGQDVKLAYINNEIHNVEIVVNKSFMWLLFYSANSYIGTYEIDSYIEVYNQILKYIENPELHGLVDVLENTNDNI